MVTLQQYLQVWASLTPAEQVQYVFDYLMQHAKASDLQFADSPIWAKISLSFLENERKIAAGTSDPTEWMEILELTKKKGEEPAVAQDRWFSYVVKRNADNTGWHLSPWVWIAGGAAVLGAVMFLRGPKSNPRRRRRRR